MDTSHLQNMALGAKMQMEMQSIPTGFPIGLPGKIPRQL